MQEVKDDWGPWIPYRGTGPVFIGVQLGMIVRIKIILEDGPKLSPAKILTPQLRDTLPVGEECRVLFGHQVRRPKALTEMIEQAAALSSELEVL